MPTIDAYKHVFPIAGGEVSTDGKAFLATEVYGSAIPIGGNYWLTAGHVLRNAAGKSKMGLGFTDGRLWHARECLGYEINEAFDVGVLRVDGIDFVALRWAIDELAMSVPVFSVGFPYAIDRELKTLAIRAFRGSVVAALTSPILPKKPRVYELQFQCPRGLSGAPLIFEGHECNVVGMIVGNAKTQMLVLADQEILDDGTTRIIERYDTLNLGIAIQAGALCQLSFDLLGGPLIDHLRAHRLAC